MDQVGGEGDHNYTCLQCHHHNDSCIKMPGSDESHFNVLLIVRDKVRQSVSGHKSQP